MAPYLDMVQVLRSNIVNALYCKLVDETLSDY